MLVPRYHHWYFLLFYACWDQTCWFRTQNTNQILLTAIFTLNQTHKWHNAISLGDRGSIPSWVIAKTQKMVRDSYLLHKQHYKVWIKDKWSNQGKRVALSPTPWCNSNWKRSLRMAIDNGQPTYTYIPNFFTRCSIRYKVNF